MSGDSPAPLLRSLDANQPGLLLVRERDRAKLVMAYAQAILDEANYELCVAQALRTPATPGLSTAELCSSMKKEAIEQRKERRAAIKAASDAIASAVATARYAREVEKDIGEAVQQVANENEVPLDPATAAILRREKRDSDERKRRFEESRKRTQERLVEEKKATAAVNAAEPEPLPETP